VAVFGCGPIGLTIIDVLGTAGVEELIVSEPRAGRRDRAEGLGADVTVDPTSVDAVEAIRDRTGGGVDVAFEAAGIEPTYRAAIESTKHGGQILTVGISEHAVGVVPRDVTVRERSIVGSNGYASGPLADKEFGMVAEMFSEGSLDPESLVTARIGLDDIVEGGFEALLDDDNDSVKILVRP
jgi:(R,R)-butanediol dehydrogenase/meso-butanediol dehydrogenase/diacetyl reductase